ncbi:MAG: hypothetical protein COA42_07420 [Alteromonadaceae bacterium]|nr:MAG: hypothetical protein COA42_07420 [Alteromonadaceae bacterium]
MISLMAGDIKSADFTHTAVMDYYARDLVAETAYHRGWIASIDFRYRDAFTFYAKAARLMPSIGVYLNRAGEAAHTLKEYDEAILYYELALALDLKESGKDHSGVVISYSNLALAWEEKKNYGKAIGYYELALESTLKAYGEEHSGVSYFRNNLASMWKASGDYAKAIKDEGENYDGGNL